MKALLVTKGFNVAKRYRRKIEMNSIFDYRDMVRQVVSVREAWVNGTQIVRDGITAPFVHNKRIDFFISLQFDPNQAAPEWGENPCLA